MQPLILLFARAPVPGAAKTRLIPALGAAGAAALQQRMLERTLAVASKLAGCEVELWCAPDTAHPVFRRLAREYGCRLQQQQGDDLGERMADAMQEVLGRGKTAIIIGTDCPELTSADLSQGFAMLAQGDDAVIGPAADGGYYLLGLRRFEAGLFRGVAWGSDAVLAQTLERVAHAGMQCGRLALKHDLDRPEDLGRFPELCTG